MSETQELPLHPWYRFPSKHFKADVVGWIRSLTRNEDEADFNKRAQRMILSTTLMLEASYYWNEENLLRGKVGAEFEAIEKTHLRGSADFCLTKSPYEIQWDVGFDRGMPFDNGH